VRIWGNANWGGGNVNVNVNKYNNFNRTNVSNGNWSHNAEHRKGAGTAIRRASRSSAADSSVRARSRASSFRGRADAGRQDLARDGALVIAEVWAIAAV
jgi:hypothetical protein